MNTPIIELKRNHFLDEGMDSLTIICFLQNSLS